MEADKDSREKSLEERWRKEGRGFRQSFVTLDTSKEIFPEVPTPQIVIEEPGRATSVAAQKLICGDCSATFGEGDALFRHWLERHCRPSEKKEAGERVEQCHTCGRVFVGEVEALRQHRLECLNSGGAKAKTVKRKLDGEGGEKCVPSKRTPSCSAAAAAALSCGVCLAEVRTVTSFFLHWLEAHSQAAEVLQEVWQCGRCRPGRLFPSRTGVATSHIRQEHPTAQSAYYECAAAPDCGARCATREEVNAHQHRAHSHSGDGNLFSDVEECDCDVCGCRVAAHGLSVHLASVHAFANVWSRSNSLSRIATTDQSMKH